MINPRVLKVVLGLGVALAVALVILGLAFRPPSAAAAAPVSAGSTATVGKTTVARIEAYVRAQSGADHAPGTAIGIVSGGKPVLLSGLGNATADTTFYLGSVSKSFTALAVMQLAAAGKVNLDAPVRTYLPSFQVGDGRESDSVTVRQLLNQTSGISTKAGLTELTFAPSTTFAQAVRGFEAFPLASRPGTHFQYSDANYTIAGDIVQQASGESFDRYLQQYIFTPLGMTHTYALTGTVREPGLTRGYASWLGLHVPLTDQVAAPLVPAGYIASSAADMTHYLTAELNGGVYPAGVRRARHRGLDLRGRRLLHRPRYRAGGDDRGREKDAAAGRAPDGRPRGPLTAGTGPGRPRTDAAGRGAGPAGGRADTAASSAGLGPVGSTFHQLWRVSCPVYTNMGVPK
jgi:CubicO group peptidase (beta-lactamase class C family)